jgi:hypothetical protein
MNKAFFLLIFYLMVQGVSAQTEVTWEDFGDVNFEPEYNEKYDVHFLMPQFGEKIKSFNGKEVKVRGYFLDISGTGEVFLISSNPMASCFFCGGSGPESIVEVTFKDPPPFKTDQIVEVTGVLELNRDNVDHCNYIMKNVTGKLVN